MSEKEKGKLREVQALLDEALGRPELTWRELIEVVRKVKSDESEEHES